MPNAFSISVDNLTLKITYIGPTTNIPSDYLYAMPGDKGWKVYDESNERVDGLIESSVIDCLEKMFHTDTILSKTEAHYFALEELEDE